MNISIGKISFFQGCFEKSVSQDKLNTTTFPVDCYIFINKTVLLAGEYLSWQKIINPLRQNNIDKEYIICNKHLLILLNVKKITNKQKTGYTTPVRAYTRIMSIIIKIIRNCMSNIKIKLLNIINAMNVIMEW